MSKVDRIMLRFRPIAPKPCTASDVDAFSKPDRSRKNHSKDNTVNKRCNRRRKAVPSPAVVTLPLLPETPDPKVPLLPSSAKNTDQPVCLSFENHDHATTSEKVDLTAVGLGGSVVTVECVTDTWQHGDEGWEWLMESRDDEERKVKLENDTSPGFISDGYGRVTWRNSAYREMVGEGQVWLVRLPCSERGFTCRVRVQYAYEKERRVPCDAWRLDCGGFAWRLDVTAALALSCFPF